MRTSGAEMRPAWRLGDPAIERDAVEFWHRLGLLPSHVDPAERLKELCSGSYIDGKLVGVTTATIAPLEFLKNRFAFHRSAVDPEHRRSRVSADQTVYARDLLEAWSAANLQEGVAGMAAIIEGAELAAFSHVPVWPASRLMVVGYSVQGRQIRVVWFGHASVVADDALSWKP